MYVTYQSIKKTYHKLEGEKGILQSQLDKKREELEYWVKREESANKFHIVAQEVARDTMQNLKYHISNIVTTALQAIPFPEPLSFEADFKLARKQVECDLWFIKDGHRVPPMHASGGGPKDVASFALRLTYWTLKKNRPTFIIDEPFKYVSVDLQSKCAEMVKMLCDKLQVQIIMVSHLPDMNLTADKEIKFYKRNRITQTKEVT